jgi:hypothetical protein
MEISLGMDPRINILDLESWIGPNGLQIISPVFISSIMQERARIQSRAFEKGMKILQRFVEEISGHQGMGVRRRIKD